MIVIGVETGFVKQANQVDIAGIVQLIRPLLAHRQGDHASGGLRIILGHCGQFATGDFGGHKAADADINGPVRQIGDRAGHGFQRPDTAQIGQSDQQRHAAFGRAQPLFKIGARQLRHLGQNGVAGCFGGVDIFGQPRAFDAQQAQ